MKYVLPAALVAAIGAGVAVQVTAHRNHHREVRTWARRAAHLAAERDFAVAQRSMTLWELELTKDFIK